ncbi:MAG: hypothetical protein HYV26_19415 [Candidatus Hydrogenedentes bacterium]|nr:hypothetical protein [Candidatus Hydrogenedentota bacterium]
MSIPLLQTMDEQVSRQRDGILAKAKQDAEAIRRESREQGAARRAEGLRQTETAVSAAAQRARERADAEAHMVIMTTKDMIADEVMLDIQRRLRQIAEGPDFAQILEALLEELLEDAPADVVVLAPRHHVEHCRQWLQRHGRSGLSVQALPGLDDGVAIQDRKRTWRATNTLASRFRQQEGALRKRCVNRLFGSEA